MSVECFLDTNVLVYAAAAGPADAAKKARALDLIENADFGLSAQVLQELYVTLTHKIARPMDPERAMELLDELRWFPSVATDYGLIVAAVEISVRYGISYWDGAIVAAAAALEAPVVYTEDLNDGQMYGIVRAVNPFTMR